jgi:hypothetical protein
LQSCNAGGDIGHLRECLRLKILKHCIRQSELLQLDSLDLLVLLQLNRLSQVIDVLLLDHLGPGYISIHIRARIQIGIDSITDISQ